MDLRTESGPGRAGVVAIVGLVLVWEIVGRLDVSFFLPAFSRVVAVWWSLVADGTLPGALGSSLFSLVRGFVPAAILGVGVGVLMGTSALARYTLDPVVNTFMSAPLSALVPVFMAIFGIRDTVVAATVFMFSFFVIVVNTQTGVLATELSLVQMARVFGARPLSIVWWVRVPRGLPAIFLGLRLGIVQAVKGMVVGEILISVIGLGERLIYYGNTFLIAHLYAVILSVLILALLAAQLVEWADRALIRWK